MFVQLRSSNAFSLGLQRFPSQSCARCWFKGRAMRALGVSVPLFSEEIQQGRVLGRHEPHAGRVMRTFRGAYLLPLSDHLRKSATGGICETSECISTNVDERVGHSVTWSFRFPLHAHVCQYHCHMDYAFISVGDITFCRQFAMMCWNGSALGRCQFALARVLLFVVRSRIHTPYLRPCSSTRSTVSGVAPLISRVDLWTLRAHAVWSTRLSGTSLIVRALEKLSMESSIGFVSLVSTVPRGLVSPVPIISFEMAQRTRVDTSGHYFTEVWRQPIVLVSFSEGDVTLHGHVESRICR